MLTATACNLQQRKRVAVFGEVIANLTLRSATGIVSLLTVDCNPRQIKMACLKLR